MTGVQTCALPISRGLRPNGRIGDATGENGQLDGQEIEGMTTMTQVAVITGAAQGIGRRTAQVLNEQGWSLVLLDLQSVDASEYKSALALAGDISDEQFVDSAAQQCIDKFGRVDALVNNAGISCISSALDTSAELYRKVIDVNLVAP